MTKNKNLITIFAIVAGIIIINTISGFVFKRFDLTKDQRYTLSDTSIKIVEQIDTPLIIDVFLEGDFPSEFRLLQNETRLLIEEYQQVSNRLVVNYINPIDEDATRERNIKQLSNAGLEPYINTDNSTGKVTQDIIFPWAYARYNNNIVKIPLLKRSITEPIETQIDNSIEGLEYAFSNAFNQLLTPKSKTVAILKGNGQLDDIYIADFLKTIKPYYNIAPFTLDSVSENSAGTLKKLINYDLIVIAKPSEAFSENEKLVLDQYTMHGGKSLWFTEAVIMDKDSLKNDSGSAVSISKELNLDDFFFKYGIRINRSLVKDLYSAPIMLSVGEGSQAQLQPLQWQYAPLAAANPMHPITKNLSLVKYDFTSPIDTIKNTISKTILLQSSPQSKLEGVPKQISLAEVTTTPDAETYNSGPQNLGVLLEGEFTSVYDQRVLPFKLNDFKSKSPTTKMIIFSDGDLIKNDVVRNQPQELGFDRLTGKSFGNKELVLNTVNYLLDDTGLINIRSKEIALSYIDAETLNESKGSWQFFNIALPLVILLLFGLLFNFLRQRKYTSTSKF